MTALFLASTTRERDREAMARHKLTSLQLMEKAINGLWKAMRPLLPKNLKKAAFLIGPGNNGADGLGLARFFWKQGYSVDLYCYGTPKTSEWSAQLGQLEKVAADFSDPQQGIKPTLTKNKVEDFLKTSHPEDLVVDALFGSGFSGELSKEIVEISARINEEKIPVWSIDVPTGFDGDRLSAHEHSFHAQKTFTIGTHKIVLELPQWKTHIGELYFIDIGLDQSRPDCEQVTPEWVSQMLPKRSQKDHKGSHGHLQIVGGRGTTPGAAVLVSLAAFKAGCGYVYVDSENSATILKALPEVVFQVSPRATACVIGPGLGRDPVTRDQLKQWIERNIPLVIDGDALFLLADLGIDRIVGRSQTVLTPHAAEFARLLGRSVKDIEADRFRLVRDTARKWKVSILLKGAGTFVADEMSVTLNPTGNEGMATAGQGDALSGIIGAFLADGIAASQAARLGAYIHGAAADLWASRTAPQGILAHEEVSLLPEVMANFRSTENNS